MKYSPFMVDLRFYAKPGKDGQIFVSVDSLVQFLREQSATRSMTEDEFRAIRAVSDVLERELEKLKRYQKTLQETFGSHAGT